MITFYSLTRKNNSFDTSQSWNLCYCVLRYTRYCGHECNIWGAKKTLWNEAKFDLIKCKMNAFSVEFMGIGNIGSNEVLDCI